MAKSLRRLLDRDDLLGGGTRPEVFNWTPLPPQAGSATAGPGRVLFDSAMTEKFIWLRTPEPALGPGNVLNPGPLPPLFTDGHDNVNFANVAPNDYDPASYYAALRGNDTVVLPADQAKATAIGYSAANTFHGNDGNDFIVGGALNDRINGGHHHDRLFGNSGNDRMVGDTGHDQLFGSSGNDTLYAGEGLDYLDGGSGDDLILATEDDEILLPPSDDNFPGPFDGTGPLYEDEIHGGTGKDVIFASASDVIYADGGDDIIHLVNFTPAPSVDSGWAVGDAGNDVILGSDMDDQIFTGSYNYFWGQDKWNPLVEIFLGGFNDVVDTGDGDDRITSMNYCNAKIDTGDGNDRIYTVGLWDVISTGDGADRVILYGGACKANLGDGSDVLEMIRAAYDNSNVSEITLGSGVDGVYFATNEWFTNGDQQSLARAPWILDFDIEEDQVTQIDVTNLDDATQSLNGDYIKTVDILGGSALIYDDPLDNSVDFCFGRFKGVSAEDLQTNIETYTLFA